MDGYFSPTLAISNKISIHEEKIEDVAMVEKIFQSMDSKFAHTVCSIEESKDIDTLSIDELQSSLLVHEQRMMSNTGPTDEQALKTSTYGENLVRRWSNRGHGWGRGRWQGRGWGGGHDPHKHKHPTTRDLISPTFNVIVAISLVITKVWMHNQLQP